MPINVNGISCILADGVRETTDTIGTGNYTLRGARTVDGIIYRTVVTGIGDGNTSVFTVRLGAEWESFIGTVASGTPAQLTRDQILSSSNGGNAVSWGAGDKDLILNVTAAVMHSLQTQIDTVPFARIKTTVFTVSGTLTTDADTIGAWVRIVAGGGAGGGTTAQVLEFAGAEGGGGGGGEYAEGYFTAAQLGASKSVSIGAGGTGVLQGNGNPGGTTNFGSGLLTALGGGGGSVSAGGTGDASYAPGIGGTGGTGGFFRAPGDDGLAGSVRVGRRGGLASGGGTRLGAVRTLDADPGTGRAGRNYGGGGTGASESTGGPARAGGPGAPGVCIVVEYLHV